jgi:O-antigen/teichoic acid export membrane protein
MIGVRARELVADGVQVLVTRGLGLIGAAGVSILISRALGPEGRGTYVIPGIVASFVATVFAGLSTAVASSMLKDDSGRGALRAAFLAAIPFVGGGAIVAVALTAAMHELWAAPYAALILPFMATSAIVNGYGYGRKKVRAVALFALSAPIATLAFLAAGFALRGPSPWVAIPMWLAGNACVALAGFAVVFLTSRRLNDRVVPVEPFLRYALAVGATGLVSMLNYRVDLYIVAALTTHAELGLYTTAVSAAETLFVAAQVGSVVTLPQMGSLPQAEAALLTARCVRNNLVFVGICGLIAIALARPLVDLLYGPAFLPAVVPLQILVLGIVPFSAAGIISSYFTLNGRRPQVALCTAGGSAAACAVIAILLVPRLGITGAAIATTLTYAASVLVMSAYFSRQTKIPFSRILLFQPEDLASYRRLAGSLSSKPLAGIETRSQG